MRFESAASCIRQVMVRCTHGSPQSLTSSRSSWWPPPRTQRANGGMRASTYHSAMWPGPPRVHRGQVGVHVHPAALGQRGAARLAVVVPLGGEVGVGVLVGVDGERGRFVLRGRGVVAWLERAGPEGDDARLPLAGGHV